MDVKRIKERLDELINKADELETYTEAYDILYEGINKLYFELVLEELEENGKKGC